MKNKTLLTLVLLIPSLCFGEKFISLIDKDYKNLDIVIETIKENHSGITKQDVETEIKLLCLQNGIKASFDRNANKSNFLYVNLNIMKLNRSKEDVYKLDIEYTKRPHKSLEVLQETGTIFVPDQGNYGYLAMGYKKEHMLDNIRTAMKEFLVDYLESNI